MVNIVHHPPRAAVLDERALDFFRSQWALYSKIVSHNYVFHREAMGRFRAFVGDAFDRPVKVLDLACGDASVVVSALRGIRVAHYHGVDLAAPALELAARNVDSLGCDTELEEADFLEAMQARPEPADLVWIGLSLHHLPSAEKRDLLRAIRGVLDDTGRLVTYDPTMADDEGREAFHTREESIVRTDWSALTSDECAAVIAHIRAHDLPETVGGTIALGREAGFSTVREIYKSPTSIYRMFGYLP